MKRNTRKLRTGLSKGAAESKQRTARVPRMYSSGASADIERYLLERYLQEVALLFQQVFASFGVREARAARSRKSLGAKGLAAATHLGYLARVLGRWAEDPSYVNDQGRPRDLSETGKSSFASLVTQEIPGEDADRCLGALLETGSVVRLRNGLLRWRRRAAISRSSTNILELLRPVRALLMVLQPAAVMGRAPISSFARGVSGFEVAEEDIPDLNALLEHHGMMLLELVDNFLSRRARAHVGQRRKRTRLLRPYVGIVMSADGDMPIGIKGLKRRRR
jgi:hypothetical protein